MSPFRAEGSPAAGGHCLAVFALGLVACCGSWELQAGRRALPGSSHHASALPVFFALVPLFCLNAPLQTSPWGLGGAREGLQSIPALSRERAVASVGFRCEKAVCWCCLSPPVVRDVPCPCALPRLWEVPGELPRLGWWAASLLPSPCPPCICTPLWRPAAAESLAWLVQFQSTK